MNEYTKKLMDYIDSGDKPKMKRYYVQTYNTDSGAYSRMTFEAKNLEKLDEEIERFIDNDNYDNDYDYWDFKVEILAVEEIEE